MTPNLFATGLALVLAAFAFTVFISGWRRQKKLEQELDTTTRILDNLNAYFIVVDSGFVVLKTNYYALNHLSADKRSKRLGDLLHCRNAVEASGCGLHEKCSACSIRATIGKAFAAKESFKHLEATMKIRRADNHKVVPCDVSVSGTYLEMDGGTPRLVLTVIDITRLKNTQRQLDAERRHAVASDRMKTAFIANMSHEIRTPLNAVVGFSGLLASSPDPQEVNAYTRIIEKNSQHLLRLFDNILDLSKIESGVADFQFSDFRADELLKDLYGNFKADLDEKPEVAFIIDPVDESIVLHSERERIAQVLSNFIHNAVKFTEKGGIHVGCLENIEGEEVRFYVADTGAGIPAEQQEKIFGRFTKLNDYVPGTGLGLALSQLIVRELGGNIGVESQPGVGSTFWFTLPQSLR